MSSRRAGERADGGGSSDGTPPARMEQVARELCLTLLTARPRTRHELSEAMRRRGIASEVGEAVLERFSEVGLVDDAEFADAWVTSRHTGRLLSRAALTAELRRRGVDREQIRAAVAHIDDGAELAAAREVVRRRLPVLAGLPVHVRSRRLLGVLARRGYGHGLASRVVREVLGGDVEPDTSEG